MYTYAYFLPEIKKGQQYYMKKLKLLSVRSYIALLNRMSFAD